MSLKPEEDYYIDPNGAYVFTEAYHLKRGYCCGSGCRHCPYPEVTDPEALKKEEPKPQSQSLQQKPKESTSEE